MASGPHKVAAFGPPPALYLHGLEMCHFGLEDGPGNTCECGNRGFAKWEG